MMDKILDIVIGHSACGEEAVMRPARHRPGQGATMGTKGSSTAVMEHDGTGEAVARKRGPRPRASDQ